MAKYFYKKESLLVVIIAIAAFFRFYNLSSVPPSPSLDEVSLGYNAYSILKTGADEYGEKFPVLLRAYDDWRPALYVYLVIPFVKLLGLNVVAVRLPSVILSLLTVLATYFLTKQLFQKSFWKLEIGNWKLEIPEVAMLLLSISPWHIYISRLGHEANAALAFFVFALLFFFRRSFLLSIFFFTLSFASYQAEKIFIPLIILALVVLFGKEVVKFWRSVVIGMLLSGIILVPFIFATFSPNALIRFKATNIFEASSEIFRLEAVKFSAAKQKNDLFGQILYNRRTVAARILTSNYIVHFSPTWLLANPSNDKHKIPALGLLYPWEIPLILIGLAMLLQRRRRIFLFIIAWIFTAPLAGAVTTDAPHAMRAYTFLPAWQIVGAIGFATVFNMVKTNGVRYVALCTLCLLVIMSTIFLFKQYFTVFPKEQSSSFQYALGRAVPFVLANEKSYNQIIFSNESNLYQSYMFFLFFSRFDPVQYQKNGGTLSGGFAENHQIGKYTFRPIDWKREQLGNLIVGNISDFPTGVNRIATFSNLDRKEAIIAVTK